MLKLTVSVILTFAAISAAAPHNPFKWHPAQPINVEGIDTKVLQGMDAELGQFPWLGIFEIGGGGLCTSALIRPDWVMTAAHCIREGVTNTVTFGAIDRSNPGPQAVSISSSETYVHPEYRPNLVNNDIALMKLPEPVTLNEYIQVSVLPTVDTPQPQAGDPITVTGWGKTSDDGGASIILQYNPEPTVLSNAECEIIYGHSITEGSICIETANGGVCNGDSGGPLNWPQADGSYIQVGVTSFVSALGCESGLPHAFTRVSTYLDWINSYVDA